MKFIHKSLETWPLSDRQTAVTVYGFFHFSLVRQFMERVCNALPPGNTTPLYSPATDLMRENATQFYSTACFDRNGPPFRSQPLRPTGTQIYD